MNSWWRSGVVYQIYPKSFYDTNNDGIGDIRGIIEKLDYLELLGVEALWLCPIYESPQIDNGYDISDYRKIHSMFGSNEDLEELIKKAHKRNMKIIMDLVLNHTSDQHIWFIESKRSKDNPYRDCYFWKDGKKGKEPTNWGSYFGGSAWTYDDNTGQYYLHFFAKEQPDINWENVKVRQEIWDVMRYWMDRGVDGWRVDSISSISKYLEFADYEDTSEYSIGKYHVNGPKLHTYIKEMNEEVLSKYDCMTVGEASGSTTEDGILFTDPKRKELDMIFTFEHMTIDSNFNSEKGRYELIPLDLRKLKEIMFKWQIDLEGQGWNALYWENHDQARIISRWGNDKEYRIECAKMYATVLHMMKGTPYIYQGEEIGMTNCDFKLDEFDDIGIKNAYKELVIEKKLMDKEEFLDAANIIVRDHSRTPMQWDENINGGFTDGTPWIKLNPRYKEINVKKALEDSGSIFYHYQKLIKLRKEKDIIVHGSFHPILERDEQIFSYMRIYDDERLLVVANFFDKKVWFIKPEEIKENQGEILISNYKDSPASINKITLRPYEAIVYKL